MPSVRKRPHQEVAESNGTNGDRSELQTLQQPSSSSVLQRIRNMWHFANLYQFILLFGKALKLDDNIEIEDLEAECLKPGSMALQEIGLGFLKFLSSHRGLTHSLFDEYARRQFVAKAPETNPFGVSEIPAKFADFDVFKKIRVLQQMTRLIIRQSEKLRERADEQGMEQTNWRIEAYGWDREDRTYFVLDDNRIYRQTEALPPAPKPKKNSKKARAVQRANKRRRVSAALSVDADEAGDETLNDDKHDENDGENKADADHEDDGLGGMKWECVATTLDEVRALVNSFKSGSKERKRRMDEDEQVLCAQIEEHLVPILEQQAESKRRKQLQRDKELLNLEKIAHAKRSSRIAGKAEMQRLEQEARTEEEKRRREETKRRKDDRARATMERERDKRLKSREQRLKEREVRRLQHEDELAHLSSEDARSVRSGSGNTGRLSERQRKTQIERSKEALRRLEEEEEDDEWTFDCICGMHGRIDDGSHSLACERCNVWQHSKCLGINEEEAETDDFHFICNSCRRQDQGPRPRRIKIRLNKPTSPSSTTETSKDLRAPSLVPNDSSKIVVEIPAKKARVAVSRTKSAVSVGATPRSIAPPHESPDGQQLSNPFSSPHPTLSPPDQSPNKSRAYQTILEPASASVAATLEKGEAAIKNGTLPKISPPVAGSRKGSSLAKQAPQKASTSAPNPKTKNGQGSPSRSTTNTPSTAAGSHLAKNLPQITPIITAKTNGTRPQSGGQDEEREPSTAYDYDERSSPLPSSRGGLSPTKHSPPARRTSSPHGHLNNGTASVGGASGSFGQGTSILPPVAALSPSPHHQNLTPPVKHAEPARSGPVPYPTSQQQKLVSSPPHLA